MFESAWYCDACNKKIPYAYGMVITGKSLEHYRDTNIGEFCKDCYPLAFDRVVEALEKLKKEKKG